MAKAQATKSKQKEGNVLATPFSAGPDNHTKSLSFRAAFKSALHKDSVHHRPTDPPPAAAINILHILPSKEEQQQKRHVRVIYALSNSAGPSEDAIKMKTALDRIKALPPALL